MVNGDFGAVILSGGRSERMGRDKALLLTPSGKTVIEVVSEAASSIAKCVIEVGGSYSDFPRIPDKREHEGPLMGSLAGLRAISAMGNFDGIFLLACDLPMIDPESLNSLVFLSRGCTVVPIVSGRAQYSCSFVSALGIRSVLTKKEFPDFKWSGLFEATPDLIYLDIDAERNLSTAAFLDVDTPLDYLNLYRRS